ncbi:glycosyl hydrolase [uncultured Duncaniella sp.]|uniref:glycosyl hydrolase n=1 Tax=uncultured Duncaniella sp. TaxID=2768039 RepID=UPI0026769F65|nr:glycosyl hydrolase [uncultured Duncaniella sp.]MCI9171624.1 DNA-binding protein [Muribaculaceae bacterium]
MKIRNKILLSVALLSLSASAASRLEQSFLNPSYDARPWSFWYWMYGAVTEEGVKADLEAMKNVGLGGTYLMPIKTVEGAPQYEGKAPQLSPEWWRLVGRSMEIADSLGLKLGMHICDGFALAGGPWISPKESMQKVVFADTVVSGGKLAGLTLPVPEMKEGYYEDIAVYAMPVKGSPILAKPVITCGNLDADVPAGKGVNIDEKGVIRSSVPCWIQYEYPQPVTVRSLEVVLKGNNYQANRLNVKASEDGKVFKEVKQLVPPRHGWQNTDENNTYSLPETTARYFRFYWTPEGSEPASEDLDAAKWKPNLKVNDIILSGEPKINHWEGKSGRVWRVAEATSDTEAPAAECVQVDEVIDLTPALKDGALTASLPDGEWRILRLGHTSTGHTNATGGAGKGLECDKFSPQAVAKQFDNWFGRVFHELDPELARRVLKYMHVDSWECGSQNWSDNFASEFKRRRGYDLMPYLPLYAGIPMDNAETSEKVLRDIRTTMAELVVDVFYTVLAEKAKEYDCYFSAECVSPTMVSDGMMHYSKVDYPMGEFWLNSPTHDKPNDMIDAIHGAHVYGKNIVQAEGFTELRGTWDETPATLKTLLDRNYALGINRIFYHVNAHNPYLDKKPGMTLDGIGLFFQRDNTWYGDGGKALTDYMRRCQALLQYGSPVIDIAVFTGEEMPRRAILPDRLVPSLPGIFGAERVESERTRLANVGQPLRVKPVGVSHSANMADPEKWINPMRGYNYDSMNKDALLRLATVKNGRIEMPGGSSYRVLVLPLAHQLMPDTTLSPEVRSKVDEMIKAGVIVPELPYVKDDFGAYGLDRDVVLPENVAWTHRRNNEDNVDLYFISNQEETPREFTASFRVAGRVPELWDPMTGEIDRNLDWKTVDSRTEVKMDLAGAGSAFIVFSQPTEATAGTAPVRNEKQELLNTGKWNVKFSTTGREIVSDTLFDWTSSEDNDVKYYSGTATYTTTFKAPKFGKNDRVMLDLEGLHDVATVVVNGKECGIVWTAPYQVDITDAVKKGKNNLSIAVTNTWANALLGADEGNAPFDGIWTNGKYRRAEKTLIPAGLTGPLKLTVITK